MSTRRQFLQAGAAFAAAAQTAKGRILLKGGTIVSMDPAVGDFVQGDILIDGKKIVSVGAGAKVSAPAPRVIDASNTILIPGFIDCHRHSWEGALRRIIPNGDIAKYM